VRRRVTVFGSALLLLSAIGSFLTLRTIQRTMPANLLQDALYVSSPAAVKGLSLGYSGLLADIYWTRVVQYFGGKHHEGSQEYKALAPLLDIATTLDPQLFVAYDFGSMFLAQNPPDGAGDPDAAVALVQRGISNNPDNWRLYYSLGYLFYLEKHDFRSAAQAFEEGSSKPGAHPWMKVMAAAMMSNAGDIRTAQYLWSRIYEETQDTQIRQNAVMHLASLKAQQDFANLNQIVSEYRERTGRAPASWRELISAGLVADVPVDPNGDPYVLRPEGQVDVANPKAFRFLKR
jgi:tetratricopeptide (TPR) repeat protein